MSLTSIIIFIIVILAVILALRFLFGILRIVIVAALGILALALLYLLLTGNDPLGVGPTIVAVAGNAGRTFESANITGLMTSAVEAVNQSATVAKELAEHAPTLPGSS
ncbi:MAG TPA: hypothetical protein VJJ82_02700 [Candidatus Nanoarchaeia archaeon]|nr:hypothetical protein [Candidatus Nanoarchaeia archaeon]